MGALVLAAILAAIALVFVLVPLYRPARPEAQERPESPADALRREKEIVYQAIREMEFDYRTGKVSDEDYAALLARYRAKAIEIIKQIDSLEAASATVGAEVWHGRVEQEIRETLAADPRTAAPLPVCAGCGEQNLPIHRFCTRCGLLVPGAAAAAASPPEVPPEVPRKARADSESAARADGIGRAQAYFGTR